ncbi:MAG: DinB family protein [Thermoanaerobaculia bacterium]
MPEPEHPYRRDELNAAFEDAHREVADLFRSLPAEDFFRRPEEGVWSPAENLIHLIKSVRAVTSGLKLPKLALAVLFGTAKGPSRRYDEMREVYRGQLRSGAKAGGRFVPPALSPADTEAGGVRSRALAGWKRTGEGLLRALGRWSEDGLDRYRLPHPLLGKLSVREMLFFTHYHDLLHAEIVRRRMVS